MEDIKKQYLLLLSEIIAKEAIILGPEIAILKARRVSELVLDGLGNATNISGYEADTVKGLMDEYEKLLGKISGSTIDQIFKKYPQIKGID